jgi:hypothetical protein
MIALAILIPVGFIGLLTWILVGVRRGAVESFTLPAAASFYAHLFTIVGATMVLLGLANAARVVIGFINMNYAYSNPVSPLQSTLCPPGSTAPGCASSASLDLTPLRTNDLVLAITLVVVGLVVFLLHRLVARSARRFPGGLPAWVQRGTLVGFAVLYGSVALFALVGTVYGIVTFIVTPSDGTATVASPQPFGELVGVAFAFIPAWIVATLMLMRRLRAPAPAPPEPVAAAVQPPAAP